MEGVDALTSANNRKDSQHILVSRLGAKLGMPGIYHQHPHLFPIDMQRIDNIAHCCAFAYLSLFNLETIVAKEGEEFYCYLH